MKGDFSRDTFDPTKHFSRVLMQQGRVQLDADWNEQAAILLHYLQALAADLIGPFGGPEGNCGFELSASAENTDDFAIGRGHYYVDGILCENDRDDCTYFNQADYPLTDNQLPAMTYLAYLDVWERHITPLEDDHIREVALGGPDTATRAKVVWQIKVTGKLPGGRKDIPAGISRGDALKQWPDWVKAWQDRSACHLKARLKPEQDSTDPCTIPPSSAYRSQENQLYRVEIHTGGNLENDQPSFKWSRDNGSIVAAWLGNNEDGGLIVSNVRGFAVGQWIEITGEAEDLQGQPGELVKITRVEGDALYLESAPHWDKDTPKKVRRWDQAETEDIQLQGGAVPIKEGTGEADWIDLEDGLQVQFQPGGNYRTGDYWLIPARTTGTIEWSNEVDANGHLIPVAQSPHSVDHHYAPLWIISVEAGGKVTVGVNDLRRMFKPLGQ